MKDKRKIRWGILGTANIGKKQVIPAIHQSRNGIVQAIASRDEQKGREFAVQNNIPQVYGSYEALLKDPQIDAVYIPLPNQMHREWSIRAAEAGKHVLCEKPLALSKEECEQMGAAAQQNQVNLMEAFMYRFHPRYERLSALLQNNCVGQIRLIRAAFCFQLKDMNNIRFNAELGGGSLMDVGCYCVNVIRSIAHAEPQAVQAFAYWSSSGVDEHMAGTLHFASGLVGQFVCSFSADRSQSCEVLGTDGSLEIPQIFRPDNLPLVIFEAHNGKRTRHTIKKVNDYCRMVEHFADSILNGTSLRYDVREASANVHVLQALARSARQNGQVERIESA